MPTLSFKDAYLSFRQGNLTEEEYLRNILGYFRVPHVKNDPNGSDNFKDVLAAKNPYAESIRQISMYTKYRPLTDTSIPLEDTFVACLNGNVKKVKEGLERLESEAPDIDVSDALATLAAEKGHERILDLFLLRGVKFDELFDKAMEIGFQKAKWNHEVVEMIVRPPSRKGGSGKCS
jgi:hypothetical protein